MMRTGDFFEILSRDVEIPAAVQNKANEAFEQIRSESQAGHKARKFGGGKRRRLAAAVIAAVLILGSFTLGAAAYIKWSQGILDEFHVDEAKQQLAQNSGVTDFPDLSVENGGVRVTLTQSMSDDYFAFLVFKVEGFHIDAGMEPGFVDTKVSVEGETIHSFAGFYDGLVNDGTGRAVMADGSEVPAEDGHLMIDYRLEDGSLEYRIAIASYNGKKGALIGKTIYVELADLGVYTQKGEAPDTYVEGQWNFDWQLNGSTQSYHFDMNTELADTGIFIKQIEITPISMKAVMDDSGAETGIPWLTGVKLKDGTYLTNLYMGPGFKGRREGDYVDHFLTDRILDVDEIEAVLFQKTTAYDRDAPVEDMFYIVNIR